MKLRYNIHNSTPQIILNKLLDYKDTRQPYIVEQRGVQKASTKDLCWEARSIVYLVHVQTLNSDRNSFKCLAYTSLSTAWTRFSFRPPLI